MSQKNPTRTLTSILVECGIVTESQVEQAVVRQRETGNLIGETLVELGFTSEENIGWALSKQLGIPYVDVHPDAIDPEQVRRFPEAMLRRVQALPLFGSRNELTVAMADPTDRDAVAELRQVAAGALSLVIGSPGSIRRAIDAVYGPRRPASTLESVSGSGVDTSGSAIRRDVVWDRAGTNFLLFHLHTARKKNASEIHFLPADKGLAVFYRTDAGLEQEPMEHPESALFLRARLGVLGVMDLEDARQLVSGGSIAIDVGTDRMSLQVSHCRTASGIATVIRLSPRPEQVPELSALGVSPIAEAEIRDMVDGPEGIVIVHGPPRAGGSLVLASLAALAAQPARRTLVIEPNGSAPYPPSATRTYYASPEDARAHWGNLVVGQGADVAVLDDVLLGESIEEVFGSASVGRLVFARTDWLDGGALLSFLAGTRHGRAVLRDRPFALLGLPRARRDGSRAWSFSEPAYLTATILTDEDRDALVSGAVQSAPSSTKAT